MIERFGPPVLREVRCHQHSARSRSSGSIHLSLVHEEIWFGRISLRGWLASWNLAAGTGTRHRPPSPGAVPSFHTAVWIPDRRPRIGGPSRWALL